MAFDDGTVRSVRQQETQEHAAFIAGLFLALAIVTLLARLF